MILAIGVVIAIIAVVCVLSVKGQNSKKYQEQLDIAQRFLEDMDYERAIVAFEDAIKMNPKSADARLV